MIRRHQALAKSAGERLWFLLIVALVVLWLLALPLALQQPTSRLTTAWSVSPLVSCMVFVLVEPRLHCEAACSVGDGGGGSGRPGRGLDQCAAAATASRPLQPQAQAHSHALRPSSLREDGKVARVTLGPPVPEVLLTVREPCSSEAACRAGPCACPCRPAVAPEAAAAQVWLQDTQSGIVL